MPMDIYLWGYQGQGEIKGMTALPKEMSKKRPEIGDYLNLFLVVFYSYVERPGLDSWKAHGFFAWNCSVFLSTRPFGPVLTHVGEALDGFGEVGDGFIRVAVLDAVAHAVLDMPLKHHLTAAVQSAFRRVDLREYILAGHVLLDHAVQRLHLTDDFPEAAMQVGGIHALSHGQSP